MIENGLVVGVAPLVENCYFFANFLDSEFVFGNEVDIVYIGYRKYGVDVELLPVFENDLVE